MINLNEVKKREIVKHITRDFAPLTQRLNRIGIIENKKKILEKKWSRFSEDVKGKYNSGVIDLKSLKAKEKIEDVRRKYSVNRDRVFSMESKENLLFPKINVWESWPGNRNMQSSYSMPGPSKERKEAEGLKQKYVVNRESVSSFKSKKDMPRTGTNETNFEKENLKTKIERSSHLVLNSSLKDFLAGILSIRIPSVKIYANQASDALAKKFSADAITYEDKILLKNGKYNSHDKEDIALLDHELTHIAESSMEKRNAPGYTRPDIFNRGEQEALNNEKKVLQYFSSIETSEGYKEPSSFSHGDSYAKGNQMPLKQAHSIKTALSSRDLGSPSETNMRVNVPTELSEKQLRMIKEEVYRDIMNRIKIDFERGG
ncbi:MAG: DUF4157 domain-containing protein [Candidatus Jettenia caeni]|nr:MAG: DUF4157 domain-containing protein [Candidatus Jettenia caeni]